MPIVSLAELFTQIFTGTGIAGPIYAKCPIAQKKSNRCRYQQRTVCPQHSGVDALAGRASSVRFPVSLKFHRAIATI